MNLKTVIDSVKNLAPTPQILPKIQKTVRDENSSIDDIGSLIKVDAILTAQIVKVSNSAYFGSSDPCQSLEEAINRIGFHQVLNVVNLVASKLALGKEMPLYHLKSGELWEHSVTCAAVSEALMQEVDKTNVESHNIAYTMGLLHMIGKVVINNYYLDRGFDIYSGDDDADEGEETMLPHMEKRILGFDHAEAGAALLKKWNFPKEICAPIEFQFDPGNAPGQQVFTAVLHLASWTKNKINQHGEDDEWLIETDPKLLQMVGIHPEKFENCVKQAHIRLKEIGELFGMS